MPVITNQTYVADEVPYSRAVFSYGIERDVASTILKFFLPISLIIIVSLASLLMKVSSRLGLNGSMFLAAVLIHWRIADAIPLVAYATFLDFFMIITYATLVMVLVSGILILKFTEDKNYKTGGTGQPLVDPDHSGALDLAVLPALPFDRYRMINGGRGQVSCGHLLNAGKGEYGKNKGHGTKFQQPYELFNTRLSIIQRWRDEK